MNGPEKTKTKPIKVCFLFEGFSRTELFKKYQHGEVPDSLFFGYNHLLHDSSLRVMLIDLNKRPSFGGFVAHNKRFFDITKELSNFDVVISSVGLPYFITQLVVPLRRPIWIFLNINLSNVLKKRHFLSLKRWVLILALRRIDHIFCLSSRQMNELMEVGIRQSNLSVLHFGVDYDFFAHAGGHAASDYLLAVGRDVGRDYGTLIEAARLIPYKVIIITSKRNMVGVENMPANVSVLYDAPHTEVRRMYQGALAVLVISQPDDAFVGSDCSGQMTVLEALALGRPVIATRKAWMSDYFSEEDIFIVPPRDPVMLALKINWVVENQFEASRMANRGKKLVETMFNTKSMSKIVGRKIKELFHNKTNV